MDRCFPRSVLLIWGNNKCTQNRWHWPSRVPEVQWERSLSAHVTATHKVKEEKKAAAIHTTKQTQARPQDSFKTAFAEVNGDKWHRLGKTQCSPRQLWPPKTQYSLPSPPPPAGPRTLPAGPRTPALSVVSYYLRSFALQERLWSVVLRVVHCLLAQSAGCLNNQPHTNGVSPILFHQVRCVSDK